MRLNCGLTIDDLFAYQEDRLRGARGEYVQAHVQHCEICREHLATLDETAQVLKAPVPLRDDPAARTQIMRGIGLLETRPQPFGWLRFSGLLPRLLVPGVLAISVLVMLWPAALQADPGIGGVVRDMLPGMARSLPEGEEPPGRPLRDRELSPFITPIELPAGYTLYRAEGEKHEALELWFENEEGREILLTQTSLDAKFEVYSSRHWTEYIEDTQVLVGPGAYPDYLSGASWERNGVRFHLTPLIPGSIQQDIAFAIISEIVAIQDERGE